jgi:hypothetical protein
MFFSQEKKPSNCCPAFCGFVLLKIYLEEFG